MYQLFELNDDGMLVAAKNEFDGSFLKFRSKKEALIVINGSIERKEYIILKKIAREYNILDDLKEEGFI